MCQQLALIKFLLLMKTKKATTVVTESQLYDTSKKLQSKKLKQVL